MPKSAYIITCDVGTTAMKTCLFYAQKDIKLIAHAEKPYSLQILDNGGVEQNPYDWWEAMCITVKEVMKSSGVAKEQISGISFCSQMQGLVLVDSEGKPIRPGMSYMDQRSGKQLHEGLEHGIMIEGCNAYKLLKSLYITKAVSLSVKDPVWKYKWVQENEPEIFKKVHKWLDVKEFLICQCTNECVMTEDSAFATLIYDSRDGHKGFSKSMCKMLGVDFAHLPRVIASTDEAGGLTKRAAELLGLTEGTPVFGGGGDASLIGVGAGAVKEGCTHVYCGTSGWVSTVVGKQLVDTSSRIASVIGAIPGYFNYFAELETAGKCLEWVKDHLALDEIDIYLEKKKISESVEAMYASLYDYMTHVVEEIPAGSNGVIFTPWLRGNRCPFEDPNARGMFFNIGLDTGKRQLIRSVLEGICYHMRWMLEAQENKIETSKTIRFVGGGALSTLTCQILADVLGRRIETVHKPQNVGAVGAAAVVAAGIGLIGSIEECDKLIKPKSVFEPIKENIEIYNKGYSVFKQLYKSNKDNFARLNELV